MFSLPVKIEVELEGKEWQLLFDGRKILSIGRAADCDIVIDSTRVSRYHAEILGEVSGEVAHFSLVDSGSANGVRVNGEMRRRGGLHPGDLIQVGPARIRFGEPSAADAAAGEVGDDTRDLDPVAPVDTGRRPSSSVVPVSARPSGQPLATSAAASVEGKSKEVSARPARPTVVVRRSVVPTLIATLLAVALLGVGGWLAVEWMDRQGSERQGSSVVDRSPTEQPEVTPLTADDEFAAQQLEALLREARQRRHGWEISEQLEVFATSYPSTAAAAEARRFKGVVDGIRGVVEGRQHERAEQIVSELIAQRRFGEAISSLQYLSRLDPEAAAWNKRLLQVESEARIEFMEIERDLGERIAAGDGAAALRSLVDARDRFGGTRIYEELLPRVIDDSLRSPSAVESSTQLLSTVLPLREQSATAFDECRFADMVPLYYQVLALDPSPEVRVQTLENLVDSFYLQRMFEEFLAQVAKQPVEVSLSENYQGRVVSADGEKVEHEIVVAGRPVIREQTWGKIPTPKKAALFSSVRYSTEGNLGLAVFCHRIGFLGGFHLALLRLHKREGTRQLAAAVLSRYRGTPIPEEGYVEHRGRLVSVTERDQEIAARQLAKQEEKSRLEELARDKLGAKLSRYIEHVQQLRSDGHFESAQRILQEIVSRKDLRDSPASKEAQRLLDDPYLRRQDLIESGPPENRLDIAILGDGFAVDDDQQERFIGFAQSCKTLLLTEQPYREYQSYLNFFAVNLGSKEAGLSTGADRGDVQKDTALGGKIEWGVITMNNGKVMQVLDRVGGSDHVAVCIGNDFADVATGGGGVASLSKASMTPVGHELGHAIGGLRDEYDFPVGTDPNRPIVKKRETNVPTSEEPPNLMRGSDRDDVLRNACWRAWVDAGEEKWWNGAPVGVFEGGGYSPFNVWRPQANCKMRNASVNFCTVCMEVMVRQIYRYVRPIDRVEPEGNAVVLENGTRKVFQVWPMKPETHFLEARWTLLDLGASPPTGGDGDDGSGVGRTGVDNDKRDGELYRRVGRTYDASGRVVEVAELRARDMKPGRYRLRVEIHDPTPWVLNDPEGLLRDRRQWEIVIP